MSTLKVLLLQRLWQAIAGLVTVILIYRCLSAELQGWYYGFLSLAALHAIFDLGLNLIISRRASELFAELSWLPQGALDGKNKQHFIDVLSWAIKHYAVLGLVFAVAIIPIGYIFFLLSSHETSTISWQWVWITLGMLAALSIIAIPFYAVVEGSGDVLEASLVRLIHNVCGSFFCWILLLFNFGLWAVIGMPLAGVLVCACWIFFRKKKLFKLLKNSQKSDWYKHNNTLPLHAKLALTTLSGYVIIQIYTPILFYYHGAVEAGKMGLSVTIAVMLGVLAQSWLARSVPIITQQISIKNKALADKIFKKDLLTSTSFLIAGATAVLLLYIFLNNSDYVSRLLSLRVLVELMLTVIISHIINSLSIQLRCFADEPLVWVSLLGSTLTVFFAIHTAPKYAAEGIILSILAVQLVFTLPISAVLWHKHNRNYTEY